MTKQFATLRELVAKSALGPAEPDPGDKQNRREQQDRHAFSRRQIAGHVVMIDRRCPYDPAEAIVMLLIATEAGGLVRVPLTSIENKALIDFAAAEGAPPACQGGRGAGETMRLRERVAELEALRARGGRPAVVWRLALTVLLQHPVATRECLAQALYGVSHRKAINRLYSVIQDVRGEVDAAGGRLQSVYGVGWRLEADGEARRRLAADLPRNDA